MSDPHPNDAFLALARDEIAAAADEGNTAPPRWKRTETSGWSAWPGA